MKNFSISILVFMFAGCASSPLPQTSNYYLQKKGPSVETVSSKGFMNFAIFDLGVGVLTNLEKITESRREKIPEYLTPNELSYDEHGVAAFQPNDIKEH